MRLIISLILAISVATPDSVVGAEEGWFIIGARILDVTRGGWLEGHAIEVREDRIIGVRPQSDIPQTSEGRVLDATGLYLVPGLIDLHSHLLLHPYDEASWNDQVLTEHLALRVCRATAAATATLNAGFTALRDLGTEGADVADVGLKRSIDTGIITGPRLFVATRALVATGCYGPSGFDPRWDVPKGAQVADGVAGVRKATRQQIAAGADWIKVYADYRRRPGDPSTPTFSFEELAAIVDEAKSAGLPVAAHAVTDEAVRRSVTAGVKTIEHGTEVSTEILHLMRERGVVLCPTLGASEAIARYQGWTGEDPLPPRILATKEMFARALRSGVTIACGSDVGVFAHGDNVRELELMVEYGMSPADALRSATLVAARVLGRAADLGRLHGGYLADIVGLGGDPLQNPSALRRPVLVLKGGRVVVDRRHQIGEEELVRFCREALDDYSNQRFEEFAARFAPGALVVLDSIARDEQSVLPANDFLDKARAKLSEKERVREWISGEPKVSVDHNIASVWAPFTVIANGTRASGTDVFQLVRMKGEWKIITLAYTQRIW